LRENFVEKCPTRSCDLLRFMVDLVRTYSSYEREPEESRQLLCCRLPGREIIEKRETR